MGVLESVLVAVSLCADCFAVTLCSSVTIKDLRWRPVTRVAMVFAFVHAGLLLAGWAFGSMLASYVVKVSHVIGFVLLLYVGGSMLWEGIKGKKEVRKLDSMRNVILGSIATSIDALAVGVAKSMEDTSWNSFLPLLVSVFAVTPLIVVLGICGGSFIGRRAGRLAEILGGCVLIGIGVTLLV